MDFSQLTQGHVLASVLGILLLQALQWASKWLDGKGVDFVKAELEKLRTKMNENSILSQIQADDAVINILEACLPDVVHELGADVQQALADGKIDKADWVMIGTKVWEKAKPQIQGGANDYIKASSFSDGAAIAQIIAKRFFVKQSLAVKGVIVEPARADSTPPTTATVAVQTK